MELREELPGDKESVREIHLRAFGDRGLVVANLVDSLRETITPTEGLLLVAGHDGQIAGYVMFTRSLLDAPRRLVEVHVLSPLAIMPDYQKRGIGSALVRKGGGCWPPREELTTIKIALLGTGFGQAHAAVYAERPDVGQVVVFGRTPQKLAKISGRFGFATAADPDAAITEASVDLVDICLPTPLHAEVAVRAMQAGHDVLIELPLAGTLDDARRIIAAQQATGRRAFVDMFSRFSPAS